MPRSPYSGTEDAVSKVPVIVCHRVLFPSLKYNKYRFTEMLPQGSNNIRSEDLQRALTT